MKVVENLEVAERRPLSRPKATQRKYIQQDLEWLGVNEELTEIEEDGGESTHV